MIDNKSIRSIARNMEVSDFFYQASSAWRHLVFLIQDSFYHKPWKTKGKTKLKSFSTIKLPLQLNMLCSFTDEKKFCQNQMMNSQKNVLVLIKTKHPVHIMMFGSLAILTLCLHSSSSINSESMQRPTSSAWRRECFPGC